MKTPFTKKTKTGIMALLAFSALAATVAVAGQDTFEDRLIGPPAAVPTHGARATWDNRDGWSGSSQQHTPGMHGMAPWSGARMVYNRSEGYTGLHPQPAANIRQIVMDKQRLDAQKMLLEISASQEKLWANYVVSVTHHNALIQEVIHLSNTNFDSPRDHANLHNELKRTLLVHDTELKASYEKLLESLPENKRAILKRSYEQVLYQHQQMSRFIRETM